HMHFHLADAVQIHPPLIGQPAGTVTVFGPLHTVETGVALEPRIPRCLPSLDAAEELGERLVQPSQRGLLRWERPHRLIRARRPDGRQLCRLIAVINPSLAVRPSVPAFLQGSVVQLSDAHPHTPPTRHADAPSDVAGTHRRVASSHPIPLMLDVAAHRQLRDLSHRGGENTTATTTPWRTAAGKETQRPAPARCGP